jgi:hypothetical protein
MESNNWLEMHYDMTLADLLENRNADPAINGTAFESAEARAEGLASRLEVETTAFGGAVRDASKPGKLLEHASWRVGAEEADVSLKSSGAVVADL